MKDLNRCSSIMVKPSNCLNPLSIRDLACDPKLFTRQLLKVFTGKRGMVTMSVYPTRLFLKIK